MVKSKCTKSHSGLRCLPHVFDDPFIAEFARLPAKPLKKNFRVFRWALSMRETEEDSWLKEIIEREWFERWVVCLKYFMRLFQFEKIDLKANLWNLKWSKLSSGSKSYLWWILNFIFSLAETIIWRLNILYQYFLLFGKKGQRIH